MNSRIERLRNELLETIPEICPERAKIFTEAVKKNEGYPIAIRRAKGFYEVLDKMSLYVRKGELIVGNQAGKPRATPVFPEYSIEWLEKEFAGDPYHFQERPCDKFTYSEEAENTILDTLNYWRNKSLYENFRSLLPEEINTAWDMGVIDDTWVSAAGFGNVLPDFDLILKEGLAGIIDRAKKRLNEINLTEPDEVKKYWFLQAVITANEAVINFAKRYSKKLLEMAAIEKDVTRKKELEEMAANCSHVPAKPARSLWEALQSVWFILLTIQIETNGHAVSLGRFDQYLWPYYKNDLDNNRIDRKTALELIESFFIKTNEINKLRSWPDTEFFPGYHLAINLAIGGQTADGSDAVNDLSYLVVESCQNLKLTTPSVSIKWFNGTADDFMKEALVAVQTHQGGQPAFYNDQGVIKILENMGIKEEDLYNWAPVGCIEATIPGKWDFAAKGPWLNTAKVLELTLNNGKDPATGITLCPGDGDLTTFNSMEEIMAAFKKQLHYFMELQVATEHINDELHKLYDINAFRSSLVHDCIERGRSLIEGGSVYSADGGPTAGSVTAGDSLAAIETVVFKNKWLTGEQLQHALLTNFKDMTTSPTGEEIRQMLINKAPKFGNDNDEADKWAIALTDYIGSTYQKDFKNSRYGKGPIPSTYAYSQSPVTGNVAFGSFIGATPDGREKAKPVNNGISPSNGAEKNGPTAAINSVGKLPSIWFQKGAIFNMRLTPDSLLTSAGRNRVLGLIKTLFNKDQYHIQFNVVDNKTLHDAQIHPEQYRDLMVRVSGYSALFTPLNRELQDDIIERVKFDTAN